MKSNNMHQITNNRNDSSESGNQISPNLASHNLGAKNNDELLENKKAFENIMQFIKKNDPNQKSLDLFLYKCLNSKYSINDLNFKKIIKYLKKNDYISEINFTNNKKIKNLSSITPLLYNPNITSIRSVNCKFQYIQNPYEELLETVHLSNKSWPAEANNENNKSTIYGTPITKEIKESYAELNKAFLKLQQLIIIEDRFKKTKDRKGNDDFAEALAHNRTLISIYMDRCGLNLEDWMENYKNNIQQLSYNTLIIEALKNNHVILNFSPINEHKYIKRNQKEFKIRINNILYDNDNDNIYINKLLASTSYTIMSQIYFLLKNVPSINDIYVVKNVNTIKNLKLAFYKLFTCQQFNAKNLPKSYGICHTITPPEGSILVLPPEIIEIIFKYMHTSEHTSELKKYIPEIEKYEKELINSK